MVSGVRFSFDPSKPAGKRVLADSIQNTKGEKLDKRKTYIVATIPFLAGGGDGYVTFKDPSIKQFGNKVDTLPSMQDILISCMRDFRKTDSELEELT